LAAWALYSYNHRSLPPIEWSSIDIPAAGIGASLRTELLSGDVLYQLRVRPLSVELAKPFSTVAQSNFLARQFTVTLLDAGGFELCKEEIATGPEVGNTGDISALVANGKLGLLGNCNANQYGQAKSWNIAYNFPKISAPVAPAKPAPITNVPWKDKNTWRQLQIGMTKAEVRSLLGEPGYIENFDTGDNWFYPNTGYAFVQFDEGGHLSHWAEPH